MVVDRSSGRSDRRAPGARLPPHQPTAYASDAILMVRPALPAVTVDIGPDSGARGSLVRSLLVPDLPVRSFATVAESPDVAARAREQLIGCPGESGRFALPAPGGGPPGGRGRCGGGAGGRRRSCPTGPRRSRCAASLGAGALRATVGDDSRTAAGGATGERLPAGGQDRGPASADGGAVCSPLQARRPPRRGAGVLAVAHHSPSSAGGRGSGAPCQGDGHECRPGRAARRDGGLVPPLPGALGAFAPGLYGDRARHASVAHSGAPGRKTR